MIIATPFSGYSKSIALFTAAVCLTVVFQQIQRTPQVLSRGLTPIMANQEPLSSDYENKLQTDEDEFLDEILSCLPNKEGCDFPMWLGAELMHVQADAIHKDETTGILCVSGLKSVILSDGRIFSTSSDGVLIFDPDSSKIEVRASSLFMTEPKQQQAR